MNDEYMKTHTQKVIYYIRRSEEGEEEEEEEEGKEIVIYWYCWTRTKCTSNLKTSTKNKKQSVWYLELLFNLIPFIRIGNDEVEKGTVD